MDAQKVEKQPVEGVAVDIGCSKVEKTSGVRCSCELGDDSSLTAPQSQNVRERSQMQNGCTEG
jgi:hypothetical protein